MGNSTHNYTKSNLYIYMYSRSGPLIKIYIIYIHSKQVQNSLSGNHSVKMLIYTSHGQKVGAPPLSYISSVPSTM